MKYINLFNIKLNQIRIFLTAVEYGNFTIAAEKLYLTQPLVSKTINHIEKELGIFLFIRSHGKLQVTPAGKELYYEWKNILKYFENSVENAHTIQEGQTGRIRIGQGELGKDEEHILSKVRGAIKRHSDIFVNMEYHDMGTLRKKLKKDELDIIFVSKHLLPEIESMGLEWKVICESYLCVFVHKSNPLSYRDSLSFEDLKTEKFIVLSPEDDSTYISLLMQLSEKAGFSPRISCYVPNELSFKANLMLGNGIVLADTMTNLENDEIKSFVLKEYRNDVLAVWKSNNHRYGLKELLMLF